MSRRNHFPVTAGDERQLNELLLMCDRGKQFYIKACYIAADLNLKYILNELLQAHVRIFKRLSALVNVTSADVAVLTVRSDSVSSVTHYYEPGFMLSFLRYHQADLLYRLKKVTHSVTAMSLGCYLSGIAAEVQVLNDRIKTMLLFQPDYRDVVLYH